MSTSQSNRYHCPLFYGRLLKCSSFLQHAGFFLQTTIIIQKVTDTGVNTLVSKPQRQAIIELFRKADILPYRVVNIESPEPALQNLVWNNCAPWSSLPFHHVSHLNAEGIVLLGNVLNGRGPLLYSTLDVFHRFYFYTNLSS